MIKNCLVCFKEYYCKPCHINKSKYCSAKCRVVGTRKEKRSAQENFIYIKERYEERIIKTDGCWGWNGFIKENGYTALVDGRYKNITGHRASYMIHVGAIPKGMCVLHNCPNGDNPLCTNPEHLYLGTLKDNAQDTVRKGRAKGLIKSEMVVGEKNVNASISEEIVLIIKKSLMHKKAIHIAKELYVSKHVIYHIKKGKTWRHVTIDEDSGSSSNSIIDNSNRVEASSVTDANNTNT